MYGFNALTTCRNFDDGFIPWTAIVAYCDENGIYGDLRSIFCDVIMAVDVEYLTANQRAKQQADDKKAKGAINGKSKQRQKQSQGG